MVSTIRSVRGATALAGLLLCLACSDSALGPVLDQAPEVQAFVDQLNAHRDRVGCAPLTWSGGVADVALRHSLDMVQRSFFDHTNPDDAGPSDRLRSAGIGFSRYAENIAYGYPTGADVLTAWLGSPGHRKNIENCALTVHGVGLEGTHWTHLFITP